MTETKLPRLIEDDETLRALTVQLSQVECFAIDTEFVREKTYRPRLCLVQVAAEEQVVAIDPLKIQDLSPLVKLVEDPGVEKVLHAAEQDLEIFFVYGRKTPRNVFDTQVAAALCGYGHQISYARLVEAVAGVKLKKVETFTDWSRRPLTAKQIDYALDDVRYLLGARGFLLREIDTLGRRAWLDHELRRYEARTLYEKPGADLYKRVKGAGKLKPNELAVLRELTQWREAEAERMDWPRGHILRDDLLVEIARRHPASVESIGRLRGVAPQLVKRCGNDILRCVAEAKALPPTQYPSAIERRPGDEELSLVVDLLEIVLKERAAEERIAPPYLATRKELALLAHQHLRQPEEEEREPLRLLSGWRRKLVGEALLALLEGRSHVAIDTVKSRVSVVD